MCRRKISQDHYETVEDSSCGKEKPTGILQQDCNKVSCPTEWKHLAWSEVSAGQHYYREDQRSFKF